MGSTTKARRNDWTRRSRWLSLSALLVGLAHGQFEFSMSTTSGYDTRDGKDAVCWVSRTQNAPAIQTDTPEKLLAAPDLLYEDFQVKGRIEMEEACPSGTYLNGYAPPEFREPDFFPRTGQIYNFTINATIDLQHTLGNTIVSDEGSVIAINIVFCDIRETTFCTPFVHILDVPQETHNTSDPDTRTNHGADHVPQHEQGTEQGHEASAHENSADTGNSSNQDVVDGTNQFGGVNVTNVHSMNHNQTNQTDTDQQQQESGILFRSAAHETSQRAQDFAANRHTHDEISNVFNHTNGGARGHHHLDSPEIFLKVDRHKKIIHLEVTIPATANEPGEFTPLARIAFFTSNSSYSPPLYKYDVGNLFDLRTIRFFDPPNILTLSNGIQAAMTFLIVVSALAVVFLLSQTIKYRNSRIMKLCQGDFLIVFLVLAVVAILSSMLLALKTDLQCRLAPTMVLVPLHIMYAIVGGRLWRVHSTISPSLVYSLNQEKSWTRWLFETFTCGRYQSKRIRGSVNAMQLVFVIILLTLPQVIIQAVDIALYTTHVDIRYTEDQSIGSTICTSTPLVRFGYYFEFLFLMGLVLVANQTRVLPSFLNETEAIYEFSLLAMLVAIIDRVIIVITDSPTTSPNLKYVIEVLCILVITLNTCFRIMLPKLRLIWEGESVTMSELMGTMKEQAPLRFSLSSHTKLVNSMSVHGSGGLKFSRISKVSGLSQTGCQASELHTDDQPTSPSPPVSTVFTQETDRPALFERKKLSRSNSLSALDGLKHQSSMDRRQRAMMENRRKRESFRSKKSIFVFDGEAPPQKLILKMVDLKEILAGITNRIMMGLTASKEDWEIVRGATYEMRSVFHDRVKFDWEESASRNDSDDYQQV